MRRARSLSSAVPVRAVARPLLLALLAVCALVVPVTAPASAAAETASAPDAPGSVTVVAGRKQVDVSWTVPADNGSPITDWMVDVVPEDHERLSSAQYFPARPGLVEGDTVTRTITGPANGVPVRIHVIAQNDVWYSTPGVSDVVTPHGTPDAPASATATAGSATASLTWSPPGDNGGSPVTGYTVTLAPSAGGAPRTQSVGPAATRASFTGLTNGARYALSVVASNVWGDSAPRSANATVVPAGAPARTIAPSVTAGKGVATVSWKAPAANGSAITKFQVHCSNGTTRTVAGTARSVTFTNLRKGRRVSFQVRAVNGVGTAAYSAASRVVTIK
jgi:hypothetical protein